MSNEALIAIIVVQAVMIAALVVGILKPRKKPSDGEVRRM